MGGFNVIIRIIVLLSMNMYTYIINLIHIKKSNDNLICLGRNFYYWIGIYILNIIYIIFVRLVGGKKIIYERINILSF